VVVIFFTKLRGVATCLGCDGIFSDSIIRNVLLILAAKKFENWLIFDEKMCHFLVHPVKYCTGVSVNWCMGVCDAIHNVYRICIAVGLLPLPVLSKRTLSWAIY